MRQLQTQKRIAVVAGIVSALLITGIVFLIREDAVETKMSSTQAQLAEEVLRFHVLANSDTDQDQQLKMEVKEAILAYMKAELPESDNLKVTKDFITTHLSQIQQIAEDYIKQAGYSYKVKAELTVCDFPDKTYGDVTFPAGKYEALRVEIGEAKGQNWWCCLYPNLCFIDAATGIVTEEGKDDLESVLDEESYEMITATTKFKIKWFFLEEK